ncbi:ubiquitin-specific protease ubp15, partial [Spiromyces aspiralis]
PMPAPSYQFQPLLLPPGFTFPPALDGDRTKLSYATTATGLPDVTTSASTAAVVPVAAGIANDDRYVTKQEFVAFQKSTTALLEQILQKLSLNTPATPPTGPIISGGGAADSPSGVGPDVPQQQSTQPPAPSLRPGTATTIGTGDVHRPLRTTTAPSENLTTAPNNSRSNHVDNDKLGNNVPNGTAGSHSSNNNNNSNNNNKNNNDSTCISVLNEDEYLRIHMDRWTIDTTSYHWWISDWSNLPRRAKSPIFSCGGHDWRIVHRPTGSSHSGTASLFLECTNDKTDASKWPVLAQFILTISNVTDPTVSTHGSAFHCFRPLSCNWGFTRFQTVADLTVGSTRDGLPPIIENDRCIISAFIRVLKLPSGINDDIRQPASQERRPMSARRSSYSTS